LKNQNLKQLPMLLGIVAAIGLGLGGCAVGPNFKTPEAPANAGNSYTPTALPAQTASAPGVGGAAQQACSSDGGQGESTSQHGSLINRRGSDAIQAAAL